MKNCMWLVVFALVVALPVATIGQARKVDAKTAEEIQTIKSALGGMVSASSASSSVPGEGLRHKDASGENRPLGIDLLNRGRKSVLMNGNRIAVDVYNYGGIGPGYGLIRGVSNVVWHNLSYVFQFCPIVGASVPYAADTSRRMHIISDGLNDYPNLYEINPTGDTLWQWQPIPGYSDPNQQNMASNPAPDYDADGKPDSWPRSWYNPTLGKYVWPGYLSQDVTAADFEVFWAMDDRDNAEFYYFPFINDSSRRGIGLQIDGRGFQWSNALAENSIFFVYTIANTSDKNLDSLFFGIYGDCDVGGGSPENTDDYGLFVAPYYVPNPVMDSLRFSKIPTYSRSLVYFWDPDGKGDRGLPVGYIACKFLESPGNPNDNFDNDNDKMVDERQDDGIDNDKDWNIITDDVGVDGIPNTNDVGEGDGIPTAGLKLPDGSQDPLYPGEPNFELTDLDESDQIGLTSFNSWTWSQDKINNDESMWYRAIPGNFGSIQESQDIVFIFGSGYISLRHGEIKRISMSLLLGETLDDMLTTAKTVQTIYNNNYRFFKPPLTPKLTVVPGDKKVTLSWDARAEQSVDPVTGRDFEGYVIYRSTDPSFTDIQTVTDGKGTPFLSEPLKKLDGSEAKWDVDFRSEPYTDVNNNGTWDTGEPYVDENRNALYDASYEDFWKGYHPIPYPDRGIHYFLGDNSGLVHSYVDSNNVINGQTYYYALVAYDHGDSIGIPPTETTKKITVDPISSISTFDINTAQAIPGPRASGYIPPPDDNSSALLHTGGSGTGSIEFKIIDDLVLKNGAEYVVSFADSFFNVTKNTPGKNYSVLTLVPVQETFVAYDTNFATLDHTGISNDSVLVVKDSAGTVYTQGSDYVMNFARGSIRRTGTSTMPNYATFHITYRYYPVFQSQALKAGDENPVFDGLKIKVTDVDTVGYDPSRSRWTQGASNYSYTMAPTLIGSRRALYPADYTIEFASKNIDTALVRWGGAIRKAPVRYTAKKVTLNQVPERIWTLLNENNPATRDTQWSPGEEIVLFKPGAKGVGSDTTTWGVNVFLPTDSSLTPVAPTDGDILLLSTTRPFNNSDRFQFRAESGKMDNATASSALKDIYVVPNPYVVINDLEPANRLPSQARGERRIYFEHLPPQCTIRVFTLSGDHVVTLNHDSGVANGREFWNLLNRDGFSIAYGLYIAHVEAPGIGETIIKFAVIK
jgi:hypothetical protein